MNAYEDFITALAVELNLTIQQNEIPLSRTKIRDVHSSNGTSFEFGMVDNENIGDWEIVSTIGDGSCLLHSILYLLSNVYRHLSRNDKENLVARLRQLLPTMINSLDQGDITDLNTSGRWLSDTTGEKIARFFGFNIIIIRFSENNNGDAIPIITTSSSTHNLPNIIIANKGGKVGTADSGNHYESIVRPRQPNSYVSPPRLGDQIEQVVNRLYTNFISQQSNMVRQRIKSIPFIQTIQSNQPLNNGNVSPFVSYSPATEPTFYNQHLQVRNRTSMIKARNSTRRVNRVKSGRKRVKSGRRVNRVKSGRRVNRVKSGRVKRVKSGRGNKRNVRSTRSKKYRK
jgi:hypothetical protein